MRLVVRVIKKSRPHYYSRQLIYQSFDGGKSSEVSYEKQSNFINAVGWWNDLFKIKYGDFRDGIESIVEDYNSACKFDITVKHLNALSALGSFNGWIFSADEDNFIDRQLVPLLRVREDCDSIRWRVIRVGSDHVSKMWDETNPDILPSGGYAFSASDGIMKHERALHCHGETAGSVNKFRLLSDESFGLVVVHPSSHGVLSKMEKKSDIVNLVNDFLNHSSSFKMKHRYKDHYDKIMSLYASL